jgi:hypothetical protein
MVVLIRNLRYGKMESGKKIKNIYCDRRSVYGNKFIMKNNSNEERERVIDEFKKDLFENKDSEINKLRLKGLNYLRKLNELNYEVNLWCWCMDEKYDYGDNKNCHCKIYKEILQYNFSDFLKFCASGEEESLSVGSQKSLHI